ncbi:MAG: hypothetical protein DCC73_11470 [Proteobacteria bacterium]|nr:MAG: hypothetical protein DCC73_11470 [Pseudomonadota bacterium]
MTIKSPETAADVTPIAAAIEGAAEAPRAVKRQRLAGLDAFLRMPDDLPLQPLGCNDGIYYYLDGLYQLRSLKETEHGRATIVALFARHEDYLLSRWPRYDKKGQPTGGFHSDLVANMLMASCAEAGVMDPAEQVRGVGAWRGDDGGLVLHCGDHVWIAGEFRKPGRYGDYVYPSFPATLKPARERANGAAAEELLSILNTWHWQDPLYAYLTLGFVAQGYVAGALPWRSHLYVDGEAGAGKSTLQRTIRGVFQRWCLDTTDTTAAALYQLMQGRAQPVLIDEFEPGDNPQRKQAALQALRQASSGGKVSRGGDQHVGRSFSVQFPALLTSIVTIPLPPQDESRIVRARLSPIIEGTVLPNLDQTRLGDLGARLMRRMLDQWPRFTDTFAAYRHALREIAGFDDRLQDTYGTLLACADLAIYDYPVSSDELSDLVARIAALTAPMQAEKLSDQARCLQYLLDMPLDRGAGVKRTIANWIVEAKEDLRHASRNQAAFGDTQTTMPAQDALASVGLRLFAERDEGGDDAYFLFVANEHSALTRIFTDTAWPGKAGAQGAWKDVLRRIPGAYADGPVRLGGALKRGTKVPLAGFIQWVET